MALLTSLLIGIQLFYAVVSVPLPVFLSPSCNSLGVRIAAEVALNKLNENRKEGYVYGLQRIYDALETNEGDESVYNLVLDVLETTCHVRSRKPWRECEFRSAHVTVFGHCEIIIRFNRITNDSVLFREDCYTRPLPPSPLCPDCPRPGNPSEESSQKAARESLAKFNAENNHYHYFALLKVTKASSQWVVGPADFVEFTIQETSCRKNKDVPDISKCPLLPDETADAGLCIGSVIDRRISFGKIVRAECEFFPHLPTANVTEIPPKQKEAVVEVTNCSADNPAIVPPGEEAKATIPPYPRIQSESDECPGEVAVEIFGLHLPSRQQDETKSDV